LVAAGIEVRTMAELHDRARSLATTAATTVTPSVETRIVGVVEYRDGRVTDVIRQVAP
jgi:citrate lyase alpha subunit